MIHPRTHGSITVTYVPRPAVRTCFGATDNLLEMDKERRLRLGRTHAMHAATGPRLTLQGAHPQDACMHGKPTVSVIS